MVNSGFFLEEEMVSFDNIANGRGRNSGDALLPAILIHKNFEFLLTKAMVFFSLVFNKAHNIRISLGLSGLMRPGGTGHQRSNPASGLAQSLLPAADDLPISTKSFPSRLFSILLIEVNHFHSLLGNLALGESS